MYDVCYDSHVHDDSTGKVRYEVDKCTALVNPCPHNENLLTPLGNKPFENTVGKGEIARNDQFLLFPQCFYPFG